MATELAGRHSLSSNSTNQHIHDGIPSRPDSLLDTITKSRQSDAHHSSIEPVGYRARYGIARIASKKGKGKQISPDTPSIYFQTTLREKLNKLLFATRLNIKVQDEPSYALRYEQELQAISQYVDVHGARIFRARAKPILQFELVTLRGHPEYEQHPWIRVRGLQSKDDIVNFHKYLATKEARAKYPSLKLCYDPATIQKAHGPQADLQPLPLSATLCGHLLHNEDQGCVWTSTLGGLIEVGIHRSQFFALSTSHRPESQTPVDDTERADTSPDGDELDLDYSNLYSPLVLDGKASLMHSPRRDPDQDQGRSKMAAQPRQPALSLVPVSENTVDCDWRLYEVPRLEIRPNRTWDISVNRITYPTSVMRMRRAQEVFILAGSPLENQDAVVGHLKATSGLIKLSVDQPFVTCWMVELAENTSLELGHSGAWVVDNGGVEVVGHLVAVSRGLCYLLPMHTVLRSISDQSSLPARLASPFAVLATLAHEYFMSDLNGDPYACKSFATTAASVRVLRASRLCAWPDEVPWLDHALELSDDGAQLLAVLFCVTGPRIDKAFGDPDMWVAWNRSYLDKALAIFDMPEHLTDLKSLLYGFYAQQARPGTEVIEVTAVVSADQYGRDEMGATSLSVAPSEHEDLHTAAKEHRPEVKEDHGRTVVPTTSHNRIRRGIQRVLRRK